MVAWLGPAISAGASLVGGFLNRDAQRDANAANAAAADRNIRMQQEFAQKGIRWKVADARRAGIHPLYALGASTHSFSPVSVGAQAETGIGNSLARVGQDVSRAIDATRTAPERVQAYTEGMAEANLEHMRLKNDLIRHQLAGSKMALLKQAGGTPASPSIGETEPFVVPQEDKSEKRQPLMWMGHRVQTDPGTSPANAVEDVLGDDIFSPGFLWNLPGLIRANVSNMNFLDMMRVIDRATRINRFWK